MKRYLLFCGERHYPHGGWHDFEASFDTIEEAKAEAAELEKEWNRADWWHVVDAHEGKVVYDPQGVDAAHDR